MKKIFIIIILVCSSLILNCDVNATSNANSNVAYDMNLTITYRISGNWDKSTKRTYKSDCLVYIGSVGRFIIGGEEGPNIFLESEIINFTLENVNSVWDGAAETYKNLKRVTYDNETHIIKIFYFYKNWPDEEHIKEFSTYYLTYIEIS